MKTLVASVSERDPFVFGLVGSEAFLGPVLSVLSANHDNHPENSNAPGPFHSLILVAPVERASQRDQLLLELGARFPELEIHSVGRPDQVKAAAEASFASELTFAADAADANALAEWLVLLRSGGMAGRLFAVEPAGRPDGAPAFVDLIGATGDAGATSGDGVEDWMLREPAAALYQTSPAAVQPIVPTADRFGILGTHPNLKKAIDIAATVGAHAVPVLVQGETGTGKELFARYVHACSNRRDGPFVAVNCGALPENLVESALFGHRKGSFTGADRNSEGKFLEASGGTLFLDEIAELPLEQQPKLLRALQEGVIDPVGGKPTEVDVRVIAASHKNLAGAVRDGHFREDLYYRLAFAAIPLPALRERTSDIPELAEHLMRGWNRNLRTPRRLSPGALERLQKHVWPGNIRELQAVIGRSMMFTQNEILAAEDLVFDEAPSRRELPVIDDMFELESYLHDLRGAIILKVLQDCGHNRSAAARRLGISPQAVAKFVKQQQDRE